MVYETLWEMCNICEQCYYHFVGWRNDQYKNCRPWWVVQLWYSSLFQLKPFGFQNHVSSCLFKKNWKWQVQTKFENPKLFQMKKWLIPKLYNSWRSTTFILVIFLFDKFLVHIVHKTYIGNLRCCTCFVVMFHKFKPEFEPINYFSSESGEYQSCSNHQDLQLLYGSFFHLTKFEPFKF
jgi:hypothetical protein